MAKRSDSQREKYNAYMREYNRKFPDKGRHSKLMRNFGISLEEYHKMAETQNYKCKICNEHETAIDRKTNVVFSLAVDHCHKTGRVRGLLCMKCNRALGLLGDSEETLFSAIKYLKEA